MGVSQKVWCTFRTRKEVKPTKNLCLENLVRCHYARTTDFKMEHILWLLNFLNHKTNGTNTLSVLCIVNNLIIRATSNLNGYASVTSFLLYNLFIATKCKNVIIDLSAILPHKSVILSSIHHIADPKIKIIIIITTLPYMAVN